MPIEEPHEQLLSSVYTQLRKMAASRMSTQAPGQTIQPTALVHEAWIRLSAHQTRSWWEHPGRLYTAAAVTMRRILIDRARQRADMKHGGTWTRVPMEVAASVPASEDERLLVIHEALDRLEKDNPMYARVVALKIFVGLSIPEIAEDLQTSERSVHRLWERAKARLYEEISTRD